MSGLSPTHERAAILLASGRKSCEVAAEVGVSPETVSRWKQNPTFIAACNLARNTFVNDTWDKLRGAGPLAVETLSDTMRFSSSYAVRAKAASTVLSFMSLDNPQAYLTGIGTTKVTYDSEDDE